MHPLMSTAVKRLLKIFTLLIIITIVFQTSPPVAKSTVNRQKPIAASFQDKSTQIYSDIQLKSMFGVFPESLDISETKVLSLPLNENLPPKFDWRDNNGNWITPVKDQTKPQGCGSCWAFAALAQIESWWKISNANADSMIDLSEQFILSCSEAGSCIGGSISQTLDFAQSTGIPSESCFTYVGNDSIPCFEACVNWQNEAVRIPVWYYITLTGAKTEYIKNAVYHQPVAALFTVYDDFLSYDGKSVYSPTSDSLHSYCYSWIVGWDDDEESWICKNSWGSDWGNEGYFRIKWGVCGIGKYIPIIWDASFKQQTFAKIPESIEMQLTSGDTKEEELVIKNSGSTILNYSLYCFTSNACFHKDQFMSLDSLSWWCGDSKLEGYGDNWIQFLETPLLNLKDSDHPKLTFSGLWKLQSNTGTMGFDGCAVWISMDGGKTFTTAYPLQPQYNCVRIKGFGAPGMDSQLPGWSGDSGGWIPVSFDLSLFKSDSLVIRFAFASDKSNSIPDNYPLYGFFIDDIQVTDGERVIFKDKCDSNSALVPIGHVGKDNTWISPSKSVGSLEYNEADCIELSVFSGNLKPGIYQAIIQIFSNNMVHPLILVPCNLNLNRPEYDLALKNISPSGSSLQLFSQIRPRVIIENLGLKDALNFKLAQNIFTENKMLYSDTVTVSLIKAGYSDTLSYRPFNILTSDSFQFQLSMINFPNDYNIFNNYMSNAFSVHTIVDDFEKENSLWTCSDGWRKSDLFSKSGQYSMLLTGDSYRYSNNMDEIMIHNPGFYLYSYNKIESNQKIFFKYWAKYRTEENDDKCYLEISTDSLKWIKIDSLTGVCLDRWDEREIDITAYGDAKVWTRFHFVSDADDERYLGILIDDVEISINQISNGLSKSITRITNDYTLSHNYPNPFNPSTTIEFILPKSEFVELRVFNILGREVKTLLSKNSNPGHHTCQFDGSKLASGVYYYQLVAGDYNEVKKMVLLK